MKIVFQHKCYINSAWQWHHSHWLLWNLHLVCLGMYSDTSFLASRWYNIGHVHIVTLTGYCSDKLSHVNQFLFCLSSSDVQSRMRWIVPDPTYHSWLHKTSCESLLIYCIVFHTLVTSNLIKYIYSYTKCHNITCHMHGCLYYKALSS